MSCILAPSLFTVASLALCGWGEWARHYLTMNYRADVLFSEWGGDAPPHAIETAEYLVDGYPYRVARALHWWVRRREDMAQIRRVRQVLQEYSGEGAS